MAGAAYPIGVADSPPSPPLNLVGDFGGGGMLLALGVVAALLETQKSGVGQIVDAAMTDGVRTDGRYLWDARGGYLDDDRQANILDGGAHFIIVMKHLTESSFPSRRLRKSSMKSCALTGFVDPDHQAHADRKQWKVNKEKMASMIKEKREMNGALFWKVQMFALLLCYR